MSQGEAAVQIYLKSCNEGSAVTVFLRIDVVGRDGVGKTSLTKSLTLQTFNPSELSTRGVVCYPNCQIIVKESCDWTTPLTRKDYKDIYDKNITAIMAESFDKPKVRDEYLSSKVEQRPMQLKLDSDNARPVRYTETVLLAESSPPQDLAVQRIDSEVAVVDDVTSDGNPKGINSRSEAQENVLQPRSISTPRISLAGFLPKAVPLAWSGLTGCLKMQNRDSFEKRVPCDTPTSVSVTNSSSMPSITTYVGPAKGHSRLNLNNLVEDSQSPLAPQAVGFCSEDGLSVSSAQELLEQNSSQPQVTCETGSLVESSHSPPSIPESTKKRVVKMLRSPESRNKVKNEMIVTILDYAGQNVFYATHQLCLSKEGFYYVVFDASLQLDAITPSVFRVREGEIVHISLPNDETNYDRLEEWVSAIHIMEPSNSRCIILFEKVGIRSPAVFLVGTHADELKDEPGMLERQDEFLRKKLEGTVLAEHIVWASKNKMCFYVDNTVTDRQNGTVDEQVVLLRQKTEEVARQVAQHHQLPITWLKFEEEVREVKEMNKTKKTASVDEILQIAMKAAGIKSEEELLVLLRYLSNRSVLLYHPMALKSKDKEEVVLDVEWLISQLEKVITIQTDVPAMYKNAVIRSSEKGIMTVEFIKYLLQDSGSARCLIMSLMNQFDLLCEYAELEDLKQADDQRDYVNLHRAKPHIHTKGVDDYQACFIPCLLQRPTTLQSLSVPVSFKTPYLLLSSGSLRMPRPLFYRLLTRLCHRFRRLPQLFQNAGYFHVYHNHKLEIVLNRYCLQMSVLTTNETPPLPAVCFLVRDFVVSEVNEAKQLAMSGLELELGFWHKLTIGSSKEVPKEFVSLEGYPAKRKDVHVISIDMDISLPPEVKVWFPYIDEVCAENSNCSNCVQELNIILLAFSLRRPRWVPEFRSLASSGRYICTELYYGISNEICFICNSDTIYVCIEAVVWSSASSLFSRSSTFTG